MNAFINEYLKLNSLATQGGVVVFGDGNDANIPVNELKQSFGIECPVYNRSFPSVTKDNAIELYDTVIRPLKPETLLLHIGKGFAKFADEINEQKYIELLSHIKRSDHCCRIIVISDGDKIVDERLKRLAASENCEFIDIGITSNWNPHATKEAATFVKDMGIDSFVAKQPVFDLVKIFFGFERLKAAY